MYSDINPNIVVHCAARVGGIIDNIKNPVDYYYQNTLMNTLVVQGALNNNVRKFIGILSSCIYPDVACTYPMSEYLIHSGIPTPTNLPYGISKRGMAIHIDTIVQQYGLQYCYVIPCNLFGLYDKFGSNGHFVAELIRKIHHANKYHEDHITLFGTGKPKRQFCDAQDLAKILHLMIEQNIYNNFNFAPNWNYSIHEYAKIALEVIPNNNLSIKYDDTKPDGQFRKDIDTSYFRSIFPEFEFSDIKQSILKTYNYYDQINR